MNGVSTTVLHPIPSNTEGVLCQHRGKRILFYKYDYRADGTLFEYRGNDFER